MFGAVHPDQYAIKYGVEKNNWNLTQQIYFWQMNYSLWETLWDLFEYFAGTRDVQILMQVAHFRHIYAMTKWYTFVESTIYHL